MSDDVLLWDVYYCPNCGYERPCDSPEYTRIGRFCPRCGYTLNKLTKVKKI